MRRPRKNHRIYWKKTLISALLICLGCVVLADGFKRQIGPNMDAVGRLKAKGIVSALINETIHEEFSGKEYGKNLIDIKTGMDGKVQMVQADTALMNRMVSAFSRSLQKKYETMKPCTVDVSYGTLIGSKILSQTGMGIEMKILPLSVTRYDFETEFEGRGINQTKYKVYITLESNVRILQPFSDESVKIRSKVLIAEAVIVGEVPESYVNVPEEDILDVT